MKHLDLVLLLRLRSPVYGCSSMMPSHFICFCVLLGRGHYEILILFNVYSIDISMSALHRNVKSQDRSGRKSRQTCRILLSFLERGPTRRIIHGYIFMYLKCFQAGLHSFHSAYSTSCNPNLPVS